ncbi:MAG TPA: hypothetical protein VFI13_10175, partial [Gemmatimonadales bacterium]|nr:hypothetical protein [Gemmatimonadales bacterium]
PGGPAPFIGPYLSPADPSLNGTIPGTFGYTSYAANAFVFLPGSTLKGTITDGTSNTIGLAEHFAHCGDTHFYFKMFPWMDLSMRRPTFADGDPLFEKKNYADVTPLTKGDPPVSGPSYATFPPIPTFQAAPKLAACHPLVPQTPHAGGMITGMMDGSVRITSPAVSPARFWGMVTPDRGEILADL